ncbi:MAG: S8 family serine peptidase [Burkholderiaceae bacterium]
MLRPRIGLSAVGLSVVAAVASMVVSGPSAIAQSAVKITAKQAALMGVSPTAGPEREEMVSKLIVKMRSSDLAQTQMASHARSLASAVGVGIKSVRAMSGDAAILTLDTPMLFSEAKAAAARLASNPAVEYAEPDLTMKPFALPNDTNFGTKQWNLFAPSSTYTGAVTVPMGNPPKNTAAPVTGGANLPTAWDVTTGSASVVIAIVDTGIVNHPDLNGVATAGAYTVGGRFLKGYDFVSDDPLGLGVGFVANDGDGRDADPTDPGDAVSAGDRANPLCNDNTPNNQNVDAPNTWHGSFSAGVAAATANNTAGIAGIGWTVKVLPVRALGRCGGSMSDVADAIRWAAGLTVPGVPVGNANANPAKVINVGAGGKSGIACSATLQSAVDAAMAAGSVVVAAAGNEGALMLSAPANCSGVIAVTAHAINGENAQYSNVGAGVAVSAPGGGSPATFGALGPIDDPLWDGYYIWSTTLDNGTGLPAIDKRIGTSGAAAQVAGVAALIFSKLPSATPAQVKSAITTSTRPFPDLSSCAPARPYAGMCGTGMLDATRALQAAGPPVIVTPPKAATAAAGGTAVFTVDAIGVVNYQWVRAGVAIPGATSASYTTPVLAATDNNVAYQVVMANSFGSTSSPAAVLTVTGGASNSPSGGALPLWQLLLLSALLFAGHVRVAQRKR